jgi:hypothetical protein
MTTQINAFSGRATMRIMLRVSLPAEESNRAIMDGTLPKVIDKAMAELKPEAAYFTTENGRRTGYMFLDLADSSEMPYAGERFFFAFNASVDAIPVMNADELRRGLPKAMASIAAG